MKGKEIDDLYRLLDSLNFKLRRFETRSESSQLELLKTMREDTKHVLRVLNRNLAEHVK